MARTAFKGTNLLVSIGIPTALAPVATYAPGQLTGGFDLISSIANEPTTMFYLPTSKNSDISKTKSGERHKFNGGTETGDFFEQDDSINGSIEAMIVRSTAKDSLYDPAIELLLKAAHTSNYDLYIKLEIWMGLESATLGHAYHVRSAIGKVSSDGLPYPSDSKAIMKTFKVEGSGNFIEGYQYKL
jgi:hypothetical protein